MNKHFIFSLGTVATVISAILINSATGQSADEEKKGEIKLALNSVHLVTPIEIGDLEVRQLSLSGALKGASGTGSLTLDPNSCALNQFGDRTTCTLIAPFPTEVKLQQLEIDDPNKQGRKLYSITGDNVPKRLFLVVPSSAAGSYRFVLRADNNTTQAVITLEPSTKSTDP